MISADQLHGQFLKYIDLPHCWFNFVCRDCQIYQKGMHTPLFFIPTWIHSLPILWTLELWFPFPVIFPIHSWIKLIITHYCPNFERIWDSLHKFDFWYCIANDLLYLSGFIICHLHQILSRSLIVSPCWLSLNQYSIQIVVMWCIHSNFSCRM